MTWTVVSDAALAVNKPARSADIKAIRDNITALANGDAGAPQIQISALVTGTLPVTSLEAPTAGDTYTLWRGTLSAEEVSTLTATFNDSTITNLNTNEMVARCQLAGVVRFKADLRHFIGGATASIRIVKNGTLVTTKTTTSASYVAQTQDITVAADDVLKFTLTSSNATWPAVMRNVRITSDTQSLGIS